MDKNLYFLEICLIKLFIIIVFKVDVYDRLYIKFFKEQGGFGNCEVQDLGSNFGSRDGQLKGIFQQKGIFVGEM